jgi:hypothetical protein
MRYIRLLRATRFSAIIAAGLVMSCSSSTAPVDPDAIVGAWTEARGPMDPPGSSVGFTLHRGDGAAVAGSGLFRGEAGPSGTIDVTGTIVGDSVTLIVSFTTDPGFGGGVRQEQFAGQLTRPWSLVGEWMTDTQEHATVTFTKVSTGLLDQGAN